MYFYKVEFIIFKKYYNIVDPLQNFFYEISFTKLRKFISSNVTNRFFFQPYYNKLYYNKYKDSQFRKGWLSSLANRNILGSGGNYKNSTKTIPAADYRSCGWSRQFSAPGPTKKRQGFIFKQQRLNRSYFLKIGRRMILTDSWTDS